MKAWDWLRKRELEDGTIVEDVEAAEAAEQPLNRRQRRMYIKHAQVSANPTASERRERRQVRLHVVGWGSWRRYPGRAQAAVARKLGQP